MNVSIELTGNLLEYVDRAVKSGIYKSRSEVVREAIRTMIQNDLREQLKAKGLTLKEFNRVRGEVSGGLIKKKYGNKI